MKIIRNEQVTYDVTMTEQEYEDLLDLLRAYRDRLVGAMVGGYQLDQVDIQLDRWQSFA